MLPYWILFVLITAGALAERPQSPSPLLRAYLVTLLVVLTVFIGLRFEVGADYINYIGIFRRAARQDLLVALGEGDPAYSLLNWIVARMGLGQWAVNLVCATIFSWGLYRFVRTQPLPLLCLLVALPYLIIVVSIGYTRQAVAIAIVMAGLAAFIRGGSIVRFAIYVAIAATFHRTAVIVLPLVALAGQRNRFVTLLAGIAAFALIYDLFLARSVDNLVLEYVEGEYESQGAAVRLAMSALPAAFLLVLGRRIPFDERERQLWRYFSFASLAMVPLLFILSSNTAIDRMALYLLPLQVAVIPRLVFLFARPSLVRPLVIAYCFMIQFVWLNYAVHSQFWMPYKIYPFGERVIYRGT